MRRPLRARWILGSSWEYLSVRLVTNATAAIVGAERGFFTGINMMIVTLKNERAQTLAPRGVSSGSERDALALLCAMRRKAWDRRPHAPAPVRRPSSRP